MAELTFKTFLGREIESVLEPLSRLRITVFREFPYLYEGTLAYEKDYLQTYLNSDRSFLFTVYHGEEMVGATTCIPLTDETPDVQEPFIKAGMPMKKICYFGESVLLKAYRGRGLGVRFFNERETHARNLGAGIMVFCAVQRPADHPLKPAGYSDLSEFWRHRGYLPATHLVSKFSWKDIDQTEETFKPMNYWSKSC